MIGWTAATNTLSIEGWVLFGIVFMWQMPHFLAIAWMFRDDYAAAGIPLLPVIQPDGRTTAHQAVLYTAGLIPVSFLPTAVGLASAYYLVGAMVLGAVLIVLSLEFASTRGMPAAKRLFFGTILYLPLLWIVLLADHFTLHRVIDYTVLPAVNATLNAISTVFLTVGLAVHPPAPDRSPSTLHAGGLCDVSAVPDVVCRLSRQRGLGPVHRAGCDSRSSTLRSSSRTWCSRPRFCRWRSSRCRARWRGVSTGTARSRGGRCRSGCMCR